MTFRRADDMFFIVLAALGVALFAGASVRVGTTSAHGDAQATVKGLEISASGIERGRRVSLQDCPRGENSVRGVIRPNEDNEFVSIDVDITVLPTFEETRLAKPLLIDAAGQEYKTAQAFGELNAEPSYSCTFSFRVPVGTDVSRFELEDVSIDLSSLAK